VKSQVERKRKNRNNLMQQCENIIKQNKSLDDCFPVEILALVIRKQNWNSPSVKLLWVI
jgi:hypothetical protein